MKIIVFWLKFPTDNKPGMVEVVVYIGARQAIACTNVDQDPLRRMASLDLNELTCTESFVQLPSQHAVLYE